MKYLIFKHWKILCCTSVHKQAHTLQRWAELHHSEWWRPQQQHGMTEESEAWCRIEAEAADIHQPFLRWVSSSQSTQPEGHRCFPAPTHLIQMNESLSGFCRAWWWDDHLNQVCWKRETSKTCRAWMPQDQRGVPSTQLKKAALTWKSLDWINVNFHLRLKPFH